MYHPPSQSSVALSCARKDVVLHYGTLMKAWDSSVPSSAVKRGVSFAWPSKQEDTSFLILTSDKTEDFFSLLKSPLAGKVGHEVIRCFNPPFSIYTYACFFTSSISLNYTQNSQINWLDYETFFAGIIEAFWRRFGTTTSFQGLSS